MFIDKPTRFPGEFKIEAHKDITERSHRIAEVTVRLDVRLYLVDSQIG